MLRALCENFIPESVSSRERSVSADDDEVGDASVDEVLGGLETALALLERHASGE